MDAGGRLILVTGLNNLCSNNVVSNGFVHAADGRGMDGHRLVDPATEYTQRWTAIAWWTRLPSTPNVLGPLIANGKSTAAETWPSFKGCPLFSPEAYQTIDDP